LTHVYLCEYSFQKQYAWLGERAGAAADPLARVPPRFAMISSRDVVLVNRHIVSMLILVSSVEAVNPFSDLKAFEIETAGSKLDQGSKRRHDRLSVNRAATAFVANYLAPGYGVNAPEWRVERSQQIGSPFYPTSSRSRPRRQWLRDDGEGVKQAT
jgi:hypothetical protein